MRKCLHATGNGFAIILVIFLLAATIIAGGIVYWYQAGEKQYSEFVGENKFKKIQANNNLENGNQDIAKIKQILGILEKSKNIKYVSYTSKINYTSDTNLTEDSVSKYWYNNNKIRTETPATGSIALATPEQMVLINKKENKITKKDTQALLKTSYFDKEYSYIILILTKYLDLKVNKLELDQNTHSYDINFEYTDNSVIDFPEKGSYELKVLENGFCIYQKKIISTGITIRQAVDYSFEPFSDKLFEIPN